SRNPRSPRRVRGSLDLWVAGPSLAQGHEAGYGTEIFLGQLVLALYRCDLGVHLYRRLLDGEGVIIDGSQDGTSETAAGVPSDGERCQAPRLLCGNDRVDGYRLCCRNDGYCAAVCGDFSVHRFGCHTGNDAVFHVYAPGF